MRRSFLSAFVLCLSLGAPASFAVEPGEMLSDPALEARAQAISKELRCPVCQGEDIDDSGAGVSHDLRVLLRERLKDGDTDQQAVDYIVARYGEYVLYRPKEQGWNLVLYWAGPAVFLVALGGVLIWLRRRRKTAESATEAPLSAEEEAKLNRILGNKG